MKIDRRKNYYLVLDVETAGSIEKPLIYDIGFAIADKKGNIYEERSFIISEIFDNVPLMETSHYATKYHQYKIDIAEGKRIKVPFLEMRKQMFELMRKYKVKTIAAYNLNFDIRALKVTTQILYGKDKKFLTSEFKDIQLLCIWSFACQVLYTQSTFWRIAEREGWETPAGNLKTSAEVGFRYIEGQYDFIESHTGIEDVRIECQILAKCFAQHKKYSKEILPNPWRVPNQARKEKRK